MYMYKLRHYQKYSSLPIQLTIGFFGMLWKYTFSEKKLILWTLSSVRRTNSEVDMYTSFFSSRLVVLPRIGSTENLYEGRVHSTLVYRVHFLFVYVIFSLVSVYNFTVILHCFFFCISLECRLLRKCLCLKYVTFLRMLNISILRKLIDSERLWIIREPFSRPSVIFPSRSKFSVTNDSRYETFVFRGL